LNAAGEGLVTTPEDFMRLGFGEILVILALALLFFGPSKLPQLGSSLGQAIRGFKRGLNEVDEQPEPETKKLPPA
jgi:sec-independent protein translocase protein TatA